MSDENPKTKVTLEMPASAAQRIKEGFDNKDPRLMEMLAEFGFTIESMTLRSPAPSIQLRNLQDGQTVRGRVGLAGRHGIKWEDWQDFQLYVQRTTADYRHKGQLRPAGTIVIIALKNRPDWAEYNPEHDYDSESNTFTVEEYYFQIEGLEL